MKIARIQCRNSYEEHQQLWNLFADDPNAQRDFLFRAEADYFYVVSGREPRDRQGIWSIEPKPYRPKPIQGGRYRFILRVNPVITKKDNEGKARRHDVVMNAKNEIGFASLSASEKPPINELIAEVGSQWLHKRQQEHGFDVNKGYLLVSRYQQHRIHKSRKSRPIRYSTLDFSGILQVADSGRLTDALTKGIGPAKAFGCGLLSLARL